MNVILESLGDPIWQIGGGFLLFLALVLTLALRSPEVPLSPWHRWLWTRIALLVCLALFLALSAGVGLFHAAPADSSVEPAATPPVAAPTSSRVGSSPQPTSVATPTAAPSPTPEPSPFPRLVPTPTQVLTTFCDAIDQQDLNTAWAQDAQALQKERASLPPYATRITLVSCRMDVVSESSASGLLLVKTIGPNGYHDEYERDFQLTLNVEQGAWKITQIARCLADGCLPDTTNIVP